MFLSNIVFMHIFLCMVQYEQTFTKHPEQIFYTRNHVCKLLYRILCGANNREIRQTLSRLKHPRDFAELIEQLSRRLSSLSTPYDMTEAIEQGYCGDVYWYNRHR